MFEAERTYDVGPLFVLPDLRTAAPPGGRVLDSPPLTLRTVHYDTADLRLARNRITLCHQRGDSGPPWMLRFTGQPGGRAGREITSRGMSGRVPEDLSRLVLGHTRGAPVTAVASLRTERRGYRVLDEAGRPVVELVDDAVSVLDGRRVTSRFRTLRVRQDRDAEARERLSQLLQTAGAKPGEYPSARVAALGPLAEEPPDLPAAQPLGHEPAAADVLIEELRRESGRLVEHDPVVRMDPTDPVGIEQLRVACRRLRTDLRVFSPLFSGTPYPSGTPVGPGVPLVGGRNLVTPLRTLASAVRAVVDAGTLRARLGAVEVSEFDAEAAGRLDDTLADLEQRAGEALRVLMTGETYLRMLDGLVATARVPRLQDPAHSPAAQVLPALAATFWERLAHAVDRLTARSQAEDWRTARRAARRLRRLSRLAAPVVGAPARRMVDALEPVTALLDVACAADHATVAWLAASEAAPHDRLMAVTVGRLVEREYVLAASAREEFHAAWDEQGWRTATEWLV